MQIFLTLDIAPRQDTFNIDCIIYIYIVIYTRIVVKTIVMVTCNFKHSMLHIISEPSPYKYDT